MASSSTPEFRGDPGKKIRILSIDGGGVRGLIAARAIEFLEKQLQDIDGPEARIADYFDVIAGTSTGGLIAAMLTCPDKCGRPLYRASDAPDFYMKYAATIFPPRHNLIGSTAQFARMLTGPKYSAENLETILTDRFQNIKIDETVTELLISAYDIKMMQPIFFSTSGAKKDALGNVYLRDACRSTSAAPTYFPPYFFEVRDSKSKTSREYNVVDGGMAANNPTYLSIVHVLQKQFEGSASFRNRISKGDFGNLLVLSLGTGTRTESFLAKDADHWGALKWVLNDGRVPLLDTCLNASADMVEFYVSILFQTVEYLDNYLRIQAVNLSPEVESLDNSTAENLQKLNELSDRLLDEKVANLDAMTGQYVPQPIRGTNREALVRFAQELAYERQLRKSNKEKPC